MAIQSILNGRPTRTQVEKLFTRIKAMADGEAISHDQVASIIEEAKATSRYRTVLEATRRKLMAELGCRLLPNFGLGYQKATGIQQVESTVKGMAHGIRRIAKEVRFAAAVSDERLPEGQQRKLRDFIVERATTLVEMAKLHRKQFSLTLGRPEILPK